MVATALRHPVLPTIFIASTLKFVGSGKEQDQRSDIAGEERKRGKKQSFTLRGISSPDNGLIQGDGEKQEDIPNGTGNIRHFR